MKGTHDSRGNGEAPSLDVQSRAMKGKRDFLLAVLISVLVAALTLVPYILAARLGRAHGEFSGFLINPLDGFSYLAKMRQGQAGEWLFRLTYTNEPGRGALLFIYYIFLGHISRWLRLPLLAVYHGMRAVSAAGMLIVAYLLLRRLIVESRAVWIAFLLVLFGSGLGWLGMAFGLLANDLWVPEAIPFLTIYANAHFPLATLVFLGGVLTVIAERGIVAMRSCAALLCGLVLGAVLPFALLPLLAFLCFWLAWEAWQERRAGFRQLWSMHRTRWLPFIALLLGGLPWLGYDVWLSTTHRVLSLWSAQNQTLTPPLLETVLGYGFILLLAVVGVILARPDRSPEGRLLLFWVVLGFCLLYAPFSLQRRLSLGLFFPLAALAGVAVQRLGEKLRRPTFLILLVLVLVIPSNLVVVGAGLWGVQKGEAALILCDGELAAYEWLAEHARPDAVILTGAESGNRLPAFALVRVIYGHPFETPHAEEALALIERLFAWSGPPEEALSLLQQHGVAYVLYGPEERALGTPTWMPELVRLYSADAYEVYGVKEQ
jgi:hypothetical protein